MERVVVLLVLLCMIGYVESQAKSCTWKCKEKGTVAVPAPIIPISNGCAGNDEKWMPDMVVVSGQYNYHNCCNDHDVCYQECGVRKDDCDREFLKCMYSYCAKVEIGELSCKKVANLFFLGGSMFSCIAFTEAQDKACTCVNSTEVLEVIEDKLRRENPEAYKRLKEQQAAAELANKPAVNTGKAERVRTGPRVSAAEKPGAGRTGGRMRNTKKLHS
eukprot:TRINITY_DN726_c0_g1_i2.p1 TRINITY_DN726_c0_g1~~TRINITY_DN726_c0_g1_i2.p1  ORF type:complete len:217 (+),score=41.05 TRINITY_DN726_c0_g1_i2:33-683(+)